MASGILAATRSAPAPAATQAPSRRVVYIEVGTAATRIDDPGEAETLQLPIAVLPTVTGEVTAFLISAGQEDDAEALLWQIRRHPVFFATPTYVTQDGNEAGSMMADGVLSDLATVEAAAAPINARLAELPNVDTTARDADYRLCAFLFSRPSWQLRPIRQLSDPRLWTYPLADAIGDPEASPLAWIMDLYNDGQLADAGLVDRVRECSRCDSAQLSFVDVCPDCRSIDIDDAQFLHCFACGHIAPEPNFVRRSGMQCPQCKQRLRHIGVDYDRPMEEYICRSCASSFVEGEVIARCLGCGFDNSPAQLNSRRIMMFQATSKAHLVARQGDVQSLPTLMDASRFAAPSYLMQMVEWLMSLAQRHTDETFSMVSIAVEDHAAAISQLGERGAGERVDGFFQRVAELSRDTDLISRMSRLSAWALLPKSDVKAREQYIAQVAGIAAQTGGGNVDPIALRCSGLTVPDDCSSDMTVDALIQSLQAD